VARVDRRQRGVGSLRIRARALGAREGRRVGLGLRESGDLVSVLIVLQSQYLIPRLRQLLISRGDFSTQGQLSRLARFVPFRSNTGKLCHCTIRISLDVLLLQGLLT
jgi:hypothetical protein